MPMSFVLGRARSIACAFAGIAHLVRTQRNAQVHVVATACVLFTGIKLGLSAAEWCWLVLAIGVVWVAEALNTAVELLADAVMPRPPAHPLIGRAKDVAAGAVLLAALTATALGACIFLPHFV